MSAQIFYLILIGLYKIYVNHFNKLKTFPTTIKIAISIETFTESFILHNSFEKDEMKRWRKKNGKLLLCSQLPWTISTNTRYKYFYMQSWQHVVFHLLSKRICFWKMSFEPIILNVTSYTQNINCAHNV